MGNNMKSAIALLMAIGLTSCCYESDKYEDAKRLDAIQEAHNMNKGVQQSNSYHHGRGITVLEITR